MMDYTETIRTVFQKEDGSFKNSRCSKKWMLAKGYEDLLTTLEEYPGNNISSKMKYYLCGLKTLPLCSICQKTESLLDRDICSACRDELKWKKRAETCLKKYGVSNPLHTTKAKINAARARPLAMQKARETNLKKYGEENPAKSPIIKSKIKATCLKKYGVENVLSHSSVREKAKLTLEAKYGVSVPIHSPEIKQKIIATNIGKYGVPFSSSAEDVKAKIKSTKSQKTEEELTAIKEKALITRKKNNPAWAVSEEEAILICAEYPELSIKELAKKYNRAPSCISYILAQNGKREKGDTRSSFENSVAEFLAEYTPVERGNRKIIAPREIDIFLPKHNLAIECNGAYWHSSEHVPADYHLMKTRACQEAGVRLIHIFEHEWYLKRPIVESILLNALKLSSRKLMARSLEVREISVREAKSFLDTNHIQGYCPSSYRMGLFKGPELVSVMTLGKSRFTSKYEWEMLRFCNLLNTTVAGGAGKLYRYFERTQKPKSIVTYADRRYFSGAMYEKLGFEFLHESKPSYFYVGQKGEQVSRYQAQKHRLPDLLNDFDENLTESENMSRNGYLQIFDCGNLVYGGRPNPRPPLLGSGLSV